MSDADCVFRRKYGNISVWLLVYVYDVFIMGKNLNIVEDTKREPGNIYRVTDDGHVNYYLGFQVSYDKGIGAYNLSQSGYIRRILEISQMGDFKPVTTPMVAREKSANGAKLINIPYRELFWGSFLHFDEKKNLKLHSL